jgi:hypothetical protein
MVDKDGSLSVRRQCALLDLPLSTFYHSLEPVSGDDLAIMSLIDRCHLKHWLAYYYWVLVRVNMASRARLMRY